MAVTSTGSTVWGLNNGLSQGLNYGAGSPYIVQTEVLLVNGTPNSVVTNNTGSQVAFDPINQQLYMSLAQGGSSWIKLGSVS